jgi:hypothetical protein
MESAFLNTSDNLPDKRLRVIEARTKERYSCIMKCSAVDSACMLLLLLENRHFMEHTVVLLYTG